MSYALDANILLYASNASAPEHFRAEAFLRECASDSEVMCLCTSTLMAFLRISTHPAIFKNPLPWKEAVRNVESLLALPHARLLHDADGIWDVFREVTVQPTPGNLVPDAYLAAVLKQNGVRRLYTADVDFRRFEFLDVLNPLNPGGARKR